MDPIRSALQVSQTTEPIIPQTIQIIAQGATNAKPIEVPTVIARYSGLIKGMLDDLGYSNGIIPIHDISHQTLTFIVKSLETIHENPNELDVLLKDLGTQTLYEVLTAADKLDIKPLLELCTKQWANVCKEASAQFASYQSYQKSEIFSLSKQLPLEINIACAKQIPLEWVSKENAEVWKFATIHQDRTVTSLAFSPDSQQILECGNNSTHTQKVINVWKVSSNPSTSETASVSTHVYNQEAVACVAYSSTGKLIASGSETSEIMILNKETGATITIPNSHGNYVICGLAFSPDSLMLASSSFDGIKFWNSSDGKFLREIQVPTSDKEVIEYSTEQKIRGLLRFSPNGKVLASVIGVDKVIKVWDVARGSRITSFCKDEGMVFAFCFSPDSSRIASVNSVSYCGKGFVRIWNVEDGSEIQAIQDPDLSYSTGVVQFTADGSTLLTGGYNRLNFRELSSGRHFLSFFYLPECSNGLALSPDGKTLAVMYENNPVNLISMESLEPILTFFEKPIIDQVLFLNFLKSTNDPEKMVFKQVDLNNPDYTHFAEIFAELPYEVRHLQSIFFCFTKPSRQEILNRPKEGF